MPTAVWFGGNCDASMRKRSTSGLAADPGWGGDLHLLAEECIARR